MVNYDIESIINDFRNTPDFATIQNKNQGTLAAWDADHVLHDADNHYMRHSLYRAYINYYSPAFRAVLGKQKVDWGRTRFWSPLDLFNPVNPLDIEYTERVGVDAVNLEHSFEDFSSLALVYAAGPNKDLASVGMKYAKTLGTTDVFAVGGQFREDEVVGFGFDGQLANAGVRGEFTYTHPQNDGDYFRSVLGLEHSFENTLTLLGEYFYNGGADKTAFLQNLSDFRYTSRVLTRNKHLLGLNADYEWTPLLKMHQMMIYDMEDNSVFFNPQFNYNLKANLDIVLGSQFFWGRTGSEFGSYENVYYIQTQFYF
ncbi:MAG: hypothetical protein KC618_00495 [Candidatus Omnitrophica bacterium]|nr:hypothetical protein [Candidatus Omnitrophota bacterium]